MKKYTFLSGVVGFIALFIGVELLALTVEKAGAKWHGPDFVIAGGQRCGTSSLWYYLDQHPAIAMSQPKEPHFFSYNFYKGIKWYQGCFKMGDFLRGDASVDYIFRQEAPIRIQHMNPHAKIIFFLRNPVERAYSWYKMRCIEASQASEAGEYFKKTLIALEDLIDVERQSQTHPWGPVLDPGDYAKHLKNWLRYFPRNQILVVASEDFFAAPDIWTNVVFKFLGLSECHRENYSRVFYFESQSDKYPPKMVIVPEKSSKQDLVVCESMAPETRKMLEEFYRPHVQELEELLGRKFNWF